MAAPLSPRVRFRRELETQIAPPSFPASLIRPHLVLALPIFSFLVQLSFSMSTAPVRPFRLTFSVCGACIHGSAGQSRIFSPPVSRRNSRAPSARRPAAVRMHSANRKPGGSDAPDGDGEEDALEGLSSGLEAMFEEALLSFYEGAPLFSEAEFQTLREELEYLGASSVRLSDLENIWMLASQERDFDRRVRNELELSEEDLDQMKTRLLTRARERKDAEKDRRISEAAKTPGLELFAPRPAKSFGLSDAEVIDSDQRVDERLRWLLFGDAVEERLKVAMLYLPGVLMSFVTATFFTVLFALLDGEMRITVTQVGRVRLGIMSYIVVASTFWFSNQITPPALEFLDLGTPQLMRGKCPNCTNSVSCLFTGNTRVRDERKCGACGALVGFNRKWGKVYMVSPPGARKYTKPD